MMRISSYKRAPQQDAGRTLTFDQPRENDKNGDVLLPRHKHRVGRYWDYLINAARMVFSAA